MAIEPAEGAGDPGQGGGAPDPVRPSRDRIKGSLPTWAGAWAGDSLILLGGHVLATVATSATAIIIARELAPVNWAAFSAFLGLAIAFAIFVDFGIATWLLREFSRIAAEPSTNASDRTSRLLSTAVTFDVAMTLALMLVPALVALSIGTSPGNVLALTCFVAFIGMDAVAAAFESRLRSSRRVARVSVAMVAEKGVLLILVISISLAIEPSVFALAAMYPLAATVRLAVVVKEAMVGVTLALPALSEIRRVVGAAVPFALSSLGLNVVPRLDALVLLGVSSTTAAYLALGDRVLGPALFLPVVLSVTLYPFVAKRGGVGWKLVIGVGAIGVGVALIGILTAPFVIPAVFGDKYAPAVGPVQVLLLSLPFIYASNILLTYVFSAGREKVVLVGTLSVALLGTGAILLGQMIGGAELAAAGTVLRQALFFVVLVVIGRGLVGKPEDEAIESGSSSEAP